MRRRKKHTRERDTCMHTTYPLYHHLFWRLKNQEREIKFILRECTNVFWCRNAPPIFILINARTASLLTDRLDNKRSIPVTMSNIIITTTLFLNEEVSDYCLFCGRWTGPNILNLPLSTPAALIKIGSPRLNLR